MKKINNMAAQGDCILRRINTLPKEAKEVPSRDGWLVIAHSETGHHHSVDAMHAKQYEVPGNPLICFLQMSSDIIDVVHHRPWDTHETLQLLGKPGDVWEVRRQREWTPEGWRRVED